MHRRLIVTGLALALVGGVATKAIAATSVDVGAAFVEAAVDVCLEASLSGGGIANLPPAVRARLTVASPEMRGLVRSPNPNGEIWEIASALGYMVITEPSPGECEVFTYGAPVERTFKTTIAAARKKVPALNPVPVTPGYDPIVYRLETQGGPAGVTLDLHGAEPGAPGHMFRFPTLTARTTRKPGIQ